MTATEQMTQVFDNGVVRLYQGDARDLSAILDPFAGSGTVAVVAQKHGRRAIGVDLSAEYLDLARKRIEAVPLPMALEVSP